MSKAVSSAPAAKSALFLDIDGTLIELAPRPDLVVVPTDLPQLLRDLQHRWQGGLALVSGRSLAEIDRMFPGLECVAGCHGGEWRLGGESFVAPLADSVLNGLAIQAGRLPGILIERKPVGLALHYRANPSACGLLRRWARSAVVQAQRSLRLVEGKAVIEVTGADCDKGRAVERFMESPGFAGRRPIYVGDDMTDEGGFDAVNRLGGVSIRVGGDERESLACRSLPAPKAVRLWLRLRLKGGL